MRDHPFGPSPFGRMPPARAEKLKAAVHQTPLVGVLELNLHCAGRLHRPERKKEMVDANWQFQLANRGQFAQHHP
jgi:hypothetical protein